MIYNSYTLVPSTKKINYTIIMMKMMEMKMMMMMMTMMMMMIKDYNI
jgi:hypothetical protein